MARPERRCLILADGWYEWLRTEIAKGRPLPFRYVVDDGAPFAFAGLWTNARIDGEWMSSATIVTTAANAFCSPIHDRMPCVLADREAELAWLSADVDAAGAQELLEPLPDDRCGASPANVAVNRAGVEGAELLRPDPAAPAP
jgi:putative SOS response-associated peptidase YedK